MADQTKIEWTEATWNPVTGCTVYSPGCTNCYAMKLAGTRLQHHPSRAGLTQPSKAGPVWTGEVRFNEQWLDQPLRWKRPRMIFVCAHGDLFHESVPDQWIDRVFAVMALAPQHTFQVLTKRSARMREYVSRAGVAGNERSYPGHAVMAAMDGISREKWPELKWPLPNVWLGVSVEDQTRADERIPDLLATPAAVRWISAEPLLGPVDLTMLHHDGTTNIDALRGMHGVLQPMLAECDKLDWVVTGGESGAGGGKNGGARPMHPDWPRSLRDQCAAAGVPFFFKQWGDWAPRHSWNERRMVALMPDGSRCPDDVIPQDVGAHRLDRIGKARAGRLLDGIEHNAMPGAARTSNLRADQ